MLIVCWAYHKRIHRSFYMSWTVLFCLFREKGKTLLVRLIYLRGSAACFHTAHNNFTRRGARSESSSATQSSSPSSSDIFRRKNIRRWGAAECFSRETTKIGNYQKFAICALSHTPHIMIRFRNVENEEETDWDCLFTEARDVFATSLLRSSSIVTTLILKIKSKHEINFANYECICGRRKSSLPRARIFSFAEQFFHPKRKTLYCRPLIFLIKY